MLELAAERVANEWLSESEDPRVQAEADRDWDGFLEFISDLLKILMPLFDACPMDPQKTKTRAAAWAVAADGDRRAKRKLGFIQRIQLRRWQDNVDERIGDRVSEEINNEDLQVAILRAVANGSDDEVAEWRADAEKARAKEDAA